MARLQILVVEDDALIGMLMSTVLQDMGYDVAPVVASQEDAVRAARANPPDLMIVDDGLAGGSGIGAMREILRTGFVPHIFVTGDPQRIESAWPGAIAIQKPFQETELIDAMTLALSRSTTHGRVDCVSR